VCPGSKTLSWQTNRRHATAMTIICYHIHVHAQCIVQLQSNSAAANCNHWVISDTKSTAARTCLQVHLRGAAQHAVAAGLYPCMLRQILLCPLKHPVTGMACAECFDSSTVLCVLVQCCHHSDYCAHHLRLSVGEQRHRGRYRQTSPAVHRLCAKTNP
jgi:hypothetical protein